MTRINKAALFGAVVACMSLAGLSSVSAQETPTGSWGSTPTWRDANSRAVDLAAAEGQLQARSGGFRPATSTTNYYGQVQTNYDQHYLGTVMNSATTNASNYSSQSSSVDQRGSTGASSGIQFTTGETSSNTTQTAKTTVASTGGPGNQSIGQ